MSLNRIRVEGDRSVVETGVSSEEAMCSLTDLRRLAEEESRADAAAFLKAVRLRDVSLTDVSEGHLGAATDVDVFHNFRPIR